MPPNAKRRKFDVSAVEEVTWDPTARHDYLTGFHKRKLQRAKHAQELAGKRAREERIEERKRLREERKADLERHVAAINSSIRPELGPEDSGNEFAEPQNEAVSDDEGTPPQPDADAEYIDEGKYTTVTVEEMDVSREGLRKLEDDGDEEPEQQRKPDDDESPKAPSESHAKRKWTKERPKDLSEKPRKQRRNFRYENKSERKLARVKQKLKNSRQAKARKAD